MPTQSRNQRHPGFSITPISFSAIATALTRALWSGMISPIAHLKRIYGAQEDKLTDKVVDQSYERSNRRLVSKSDPDAPVVRQGPSGPKPRHKA